MISKDEATLAISAALEVLSKEKEYSWINSSSLILRAYFLGLYFGLKDIAAERDLNSLVLSIFKETMFQRSADDTFPSTRIGRAFFSVKEDLGETAGHFSKDKMATLREAVENIEHAILAAFGELASLMADVPIRTSEMSGFLYALERPLRTIALFETDHLLSKRLDHAP